MRAQAKACGYIAALVLWIVAATAQAQSNYTLQLYERGGFQPVPCANLPGLGAFSAAVASNATLGVYSNGTTLIIGTNLPAQPGAEVLVYQTGPDVLITNEGVQISLFQSNAVPILTNTYPTGFVEADVLYVNGDGLVHSVNNQAFYTNGAAWVSFPAGGTGSLGINGTSLLQHYVARFVSNSFNTASLDFRATAMGVNSNTTMQLLSFRVFSP